MEQYEGQLEQPKTNKNLRILFSVLKYLAVFIIGAVVAFYISGVSIKEIYVNYLVNHYFDGEFDKKEMSEGALLGKIASLDDPNTLYIPKEVGADYLNQQITGEYGGIGVSVASKNGNCVVKEVFPDAPAHKAGVKEGDIIVSVDGLSSKDSDFDTMARQMRGKAGSVLSMTVSRDGKEISFNIEREFIDAPSVYGKMLDGNIAYLEVTKFDENTHEEMDRELSRLENAESVIVDLRNNSGGIMTVCIDCLELFLEEGTDIVSTSGKTFDVEYKSEATPKFTMPMAVLINEDSASASEIFAACIKDNGRGVVIGKKSYGKGSIQRTYMLSGNTALNLTVGHFYSPKGTKIDKSGVVPDIEAEHKEGGADTQLETAINNLKK